MHDWASDSLEFMLRVEAERLTSRVAVMHAGRLVTEGPTADVLGRDDCLAMFRGAEVQT